MLDVVVDVQALTTVDDDTVAALAALLPQLSRSAEPLTRAGVETIVASPASTLFVARLDGAVVGMLTLATFPIPSGIRAWIEDVVTDEAARGAGVGAALTGAALAHARTIGARTVELTSRPSREAANRLYQRLGFTARETNVYRYQLD